MAKKYDYRIFPETWKARVLVAVAFVLGSVVFAGYLAFILMSGPFLLEPWGIFGKVEVTYVNQTDGRVRVYRDNRLEFQLEPGETKKDKDYKFEWWFDRDVAAYTSSGVLLYADTLDRHDLKDMHYRIAIGNQQSDSRSVTCGAAAYPDCLDREEELVDGSVTDCREPENQVCFAPYGAVPAALVHRLETYFEDTYDLKVGVMTPQAVPEDILDSDRRQLDAYRMAQAIDEEFGPQVDGSTLIIGITPADVFISDRQQWRWAFGISGFPSVLSTMRMDPQTWGEPRDDEMVFARMKKMVTKYIATRYFGIEMSSDPNSQVYDSIGGLEDLDGMSEEPLDFPER